MQAEHPYAESHPNLKQESQTGPEPENGDTQEQIYMPQ